jgi:hypothetical protein
MSDIAALLRQKIPLVVRKIILNTTSCQRYSAYHFGGREKGVARSVIEVKLIFTGD